MKTKIFFLPFLLLASFLISCSGSKNADFDPIAMAEIFPEKPNQETVALALLEKTKIQKQKLEDEYGIEFLTQSDGQDSDGSSQKLAAGPGQTKSLSQGQLKSVMFLPNSETQDETIATFWDGMLDDLWAFGLLGLEINANDFLKTESDDPLVAELALETRLAGQWSGSQVLSQVAKAQRSDLRKLKSLGLSTRRVVRSSPFYALTFSTYTSQTNLDTEAMTLVSSQINDNCQEAAAVLKNADALGITVINISGTDIYCAPGSLSHLSSNFAPRAKGLSHTESVQLKDKLLKATVKDAYEQSLVLLVDNGLVYKQTKSGWVLNKKQRRTWESSQYEDFVNNLRGPQVMVFDVNPPVASKDQVFREEVLRNGLRTLAFHVNAARAWAEQLSPSDPTLAEVDQRRLAATADFFKWKDAFLQLNPNPWKQWWVPSTEDVKDPTIGRQPWDLKPNYDSIFKNL